MTTLEVLTNARALIATPEQWRRMMESDNSPEYLHKFDPRLCLDGALMKASRMLFPKYAYRALGFASDVALAAWHDVSERQHSEVIARLDVAIEAERERMAGETRAPAHHWSN